VLDFNDKQVLMDKPVVWVPIKGIVALSYSFPRQPKREMRAELLKETAKGLLLKYPYILGETEHREFFRLSVPSVSMLIAYGISSSTGRKRILFEGKVRDISMKGVCSLTTSIYASTVITRETEVAEILLKLMISDTDYFGDITIKSPKIVRLRKTGLTKDGKTGYEIAFSFKPDSKTSDRIFAYMRQRETHLMNR
jgi:hypothetical protein